MHAKHSNKTGTAVSYTSTGFIYFFLQLWMQQLQVRSLLLVEITKKTDSCSKLENSRSSSYIFLLFTDQTSDLVIGKLS